MDLLQALILGILQGITEWLPISSQGQVTVTAITLFGINTGEALNYAIMLHIGTLIAATVYFRKELLNFAKAKEKKFLYFIIIVLVFSGISAIPTYILFKNIAVGGPILIIIGIFLIASGYLQHNSKKWKPRFGNKYAAALGLAQGFSVLPGISRSGITTAVLLLEDFAPEKAFKISFLISIPSVFVAEILFGIIEGKNLIINTNVVIAVATAAIVGFFTINILIKLAKKINFSWFCIGFGIIYIILGLL